MTPEAFREMCSRNGKKTKRTGIPDGLRRAEAEQKREKGEAQATRIVKLMIEKYNIEDEHAQIALEYAVGVIKAKADGTRDKLAAARLVLDFCKTKPASKSEVTIKSAEDLLADLDAEDKKSS
jgi:hypothetical protein